MYKCTLYKCLLIFRAKKAFHPYKKYLHAVITHMLKIIFTKIQDKISKRDSRISKKETLGFNCTPLRHH